MIKLDIEEPKLLAQTLATKLEEAIIFGELASGIHLTEESLEQRTKVSRSPIREALRLLEMDGLVVRAPRRGVFVASMSVSDLEELYPCRIALEGRAGQLAAEHATAGDIDGIKHAHQECVRHFEKDDVLGHFRANVALSRQIYDAAHNGVLLGLLMSIQKRALRYRFLAYKRSPEARRASIMNTDRLIAALERRDASETGAQICRSIEASQHVLRNVLDEELGIGSGTWHVLSK